MSKEYIRVYIRFEDCKCSCICLQGKKGCDNKQCTVEVVERDLYRGWQDTFEVDRYGKSKCSKKGYK